MPLHRPRRIFRSSSIGSARPRTRVGPTVLVGLLGVLGGVALMMTAMPSALFGRVPVLSGIVDADAPQVAVVDGGTLRLRETVIRLQGLAAPARGQSCRMSDHPAYDCGAAATQALALLVRGHPVTCRLTGRDDSGFPEGRCESGGADLNRALVASGWARAQNDAGAFADVERAARDDRRGLWRDGGVAPSF